MTTLQNDRDIKKQANAAVAELKRMGTKKTRDGMARYAISSDNAFGVKAAQIRELAKRLGRNHELAQVLWESGWYEARMLATLVDDPELVTPAQMDRWCKGFDNWAICDTACFHLFDKTPHAFKKVAQWSKRKDEFVKRAAFALLASVALHDKKSGDAPFIASLPLIEKAATDERNFVKKGVSWALRGIGKRNASLKVLAKELAQRLTESDNRSARWVGQDALRDLDRSAKAKRRPS